MTMSKIPIIVLPLYLAALCQLTSLVPTERVPDSLPSAPDSSKVEGHQFALFRIPHNQDNQSRLEAMPDITGPYIRSILVGHTMAYLYFSPECNNTIFYLPQPVLLPPLARTQGNMYVTRNQGDTIVATFRVGVPMDDVAADFSQYLSHHVLTHPACNMRIKGPAILQAPVKFSQPDSTLFSLLGAENRIWPDGNLELSLKATDWNDFASQLRQGISISYERDVIVAAASRYAAIKMGCRDVLVQLGISVDTLKDKGVQPLSWAQISSAFQRVSTRRENRQVYYNYTQEEAGAIFKDQLAPACGLSVTEQSTGVQQQAKDGPIQESQPTKTDQRMFQVKLNADWKTKQDEVFDSRQSLATVHTAVRGSIQLHEGVGGTKPITAYVSGKKDNWVTIARISAGTTYFIETSGKWQPPGEGRQLAPCEGKEANDQFISPERPAYSLLLYFISRNGDQKYLDCPTRPARFSESTEGVLFGQMNFKKERHGGGRGTIKVTLTPQP